MTTTATYPTPSEIRAAIERSCKRNLGAIPVVAYLTHRMTWNGEGMDIVATAVVVWTDRGVALQGTIDELLGVCGDPCAVQPPTEAAPR